MEHIATLHIEKLPEGFYLATSDDIPGLVAQGRTIAETVEIARDIAKKLLEARQERQTPIHLNEVEDVLAIASSATCSSPIVLNNSAQVVSSGLV
jgi:predicted RNase H-like HicB family nuclease